MLSRDRLLEVVSYDVGTGVMTWMAANKWRAGKKAGCIRKDGYIVIRIDGELMYAHRLAWLYVYGAWPSDFIDHINGITGDNRICNLRDVPVAINSQNQRRASRTNKASKLLGVQRNHGGWQAVITTAGKRRCLGTFPSPQEAHAVYLTEKRKVHAGCTI